MQGNEFSFLLYVSEFLKKASKHGSHKYHGGIFRVTTRREAKCYVWPLKEVR